MTHPLRSSSSHPCPRRSRLMVGSAALAIALALAAPQRLNAQAINAESTVTYGAAEIDQSLPNQTQVEVGSSVSVIDWQPFEDAGGNALDFLPTGTTVTFQNTPGQGEFAVLNRILPATNNNIAVINGTVVSRVLDSSGIAAPGGFIAFYSPTGLLVGSTASFDVGSLMLTTLDADPVNFDNFFTNGSQLFLSGAPGSTARIQIAAGAQITATPENAFFAVVAADVQMSGTARINGSHAYIAGEQVRLRFSNGLFDIFVDAGTAAAGEVVTLNGTIGGPSSNGGTLDNHMIYAVARASQDPISMLFSGNLGFDPAQSAGIVNGEIILAANYNVFGRTVNGDTIRNGITADFFAENALTDVQGDVTLRDFSSSSTVLAVSNGNTVAGGNSDVTGDLLLVATQRAAIDVSGDNLFEVSGDVLVDAVDFGAVGSSLQSLDAINATGGTAQILAQEGGVVQIGGNVAVLADAIAGANDLSRTGGSAQAGTAQILAEEGQITIAGELTLRAAGIGSTIDNIITGAVARGGTAQLEAGTDGIVSIGTGLFIDASAFGAEGDLANPSTVSDAFGGTALLAITGNGIVGVDAGLVTVTANAVAGSANTSGPGALADAGSAEVAVEGTGRLTIVAGLELEANAEGGANAGGIGGEALGGAARLVTRGAGQVSVSGDFLAFATATGGNGIGGGDAFGGLAGANAIGGSMTLLADATSDSRGTGGEADFGFGGDGGTGRGGNAFFQADGSVNQLASIAITGQASLRADGFGGSGGASDGQAIAAGNGGDGFGGDFTIPNQADPTFNSGAFLLAGGDYGTISVGGEAFVFAQGDGGRGGSGGGQFTPGAGGNGLGGLAQAGLALLGGPGTVGGGSATFASLTIDAIGFGGVGGLDVQTDENVGLGGNGTGGTAFLSVRSGEVLADLVNINAIGFGGTGTDGGIGTGGTAGIAGTGGGTFESDTVTLLAGGLGGFSITGRGGDGIGGIAVIEGDGLAITISSGAVVDASGSGAAPADGEGGNGAGGQAFIGFANAVTTGSIAIGGHTQVFANGEGASTIGDFAAGNGTGGRATIQAQGGGTITLSSAQVVATGRGGDAGGNTGGNGTGGFAELLSLGTGSLLTITDYVPSDFLSGPGDGAVANADGIGGATNGGSGIGGLGRGGEVLVRASAGGRVVLPSGPSIDPGTPAIVNLFARGFGGGSSSIGGAGGAGRGGAAVLFADGGVIEVGTLFVAATASGGSGGVSTHTTAGGAASGGGVGFTVNNGGALTIGSSQFMSGARAGNATGDGNGGAAVAGSADFALNGGTLNLNGTLSVMDETVGGIGRNGGSALVQGEGGVVEFTADNSTISVSGGAGLEFITVATGGDGLDLGGRADATPIALSFTNTDVSGDVLRVTSRARGGNGTAPNGTGGLANGGSITVSLTDADVTFIGEVGIISEAFGGGGGLVDGTGGNAVAGIAELSAVRSSFEVSALAGVGGILRLGANAVAGVGLNAATATGNRARLALNASVLRVDQVFVDASVTADGAQGGTARGGLAAVDIAGASQIESSQIEITGNGQTLGLGTAEGGTARFQTATGSTATVTVQDITLRANALGGTAGGGSNAAGQFVFNVQGGTVDVQNLTFQARGFSVGGNLPASLIRAVGGAINIGSSLSADAFGDIAIETGNAGTIVGPVSPGGEIEIAVSSRQRIAIGGDNAGVTGLVADAVRLSARALDITDGARIEAGRVEIASIEFDVAAQVGGTTEAASGFSLTAPEIGRINARELIVSLREVEGLSDPNAADVVIRDLGLIGSQDGGFEFVRIDVGDEARGIMRIEGTLSFGDAGVEDTLSLSAGERIEIVTPGGIRITDSSNRPGGNLDLLAGYIWAADADLIAELQDNPTFAGRDVILATAAAGSADPLGYIRARDVDIEISRGLLVRNTGSALQQGGILVGEGGLSIVGFDPLDSATAGSFTTFRNAGLLDVFAYGRAQLSNGTFVTGEAFFREVNFNSAGQDPTTYSAASALNDCIITTGQCPEPPRPEQEPPAQINNPGVFERPIDIVETPPSVEGEEEERFGIDFPDRPEAPLIAEDPLLDDPVASGSDASAYGTPAPPSGGGK
jgi:hypothetical protein